MALTMKERYNLLDMSKLPANVKSEFDEIKSGTEDFSDQDLMDVFKENFDDLYKIVEDRYPEVLKKGKVTKVKKLVEKKIKAKKPAVKHKKLSDDDIEFIESTLLNDEASTDAELVKYFMAEVGLSELQAKKWVAQRSKYLAAEVGKGRSISYKIRKGVKGKKGRQVVLKPDKEVAKEPDEIANCKKVLEDANYRIEKKLKKGKRVTHRIKRLDKTIIAEKTDDVVTTIDKELRASDETIKDNKAILSLTDRLRDVLTRILQSLDKIVADGKQSELKKIVDLLEKIAP
jgi:hypothetical protein